jgi:hypothetical protein
MLNQAKEKCVEKHKVGNDSVRKLLPLPSVKKLLIRRQHSDYFCAKKRIDTLNAPLVDCVKSHSLTGSATLTWSTCLRGLLCLRASQGSEKV